VERAAERALVRGPAGMDGSRAGRMVGKLAGRLARIMAGILARIIAGILAGRVAGPRVAKKEISPARSGAPERATP